MSKTYVTLGCFYGDASPGAVVALEADEAQRLVDLGAAKPAAAPVANEPEEAKPAKPAKPAGAAQA